MLSTGYPNRFSPGYPELKDDIHFSIFTARSKLNVKVDTPFPALSGAGGGNARTDPSLRETVPDCSTENTGD